MIDRSRQQPVAVSVILPVRNGAEYLEHTLAALARSTRTDYELLVVDDASTDAGPAMLAARGIAPVTRSATARGPFACRNLAASRARGAILVFLDADVEVYPDTLARLIARLEAGCDAAIGRYALEHPNPDAVSRFKNAWIHHSYGERLRPVGWFFTAVGAVRREVFEATGGFDEAFQPRTGGGDVDFGRRLRREGRTILLDPTIEVVHRKRFDLRGLLDNDLNRARGWARLALSGRGSTGGLDDGRVLSGIANVGADFVVAVAACGAALAALGAVLLGGGQLAAALVAASAIVWLGANAEFAAFVAAALGPATAIRWLPLLWLDQTACGFGVARAILEHIAGGRVIAPGRHRAADTGTSPEVPTRPDPSPPERGGEASD